MNENSFQSFLVVDQDFVWYSSAVHDVSGSYQSAKKPALRNVSVTSIVSHYGATDFSQHLSSFIDMEPLAGNIAPSAASTFDLYKQVVFSSPVKSSFFTSKRGNWQP